MSKLGDINTTLREKKRQKRERLLQGAYALFRDKGVEETAIDDIVRESGVAKGTFYLYFRNKTEILADVVSEKSREILKEAYARVSVAYAEPSARGLIAFIECLIDRLEEDKVLLEMVYKNLNWGFYRKIVSEADETLSRLRADFLACLSATDAPERDPDKLLFVIIELTSSICYSAIIRNEPSTMKEMKPILLDSVRRIVS